MESINKIAVTKGIFLLGLVMFIALSAGCGSRTTANASPQTAKVSGDFRINNFGWRSADNKIAVLLNHGWEPVELISLKSDGSISSVAATYMASQAQVENSYSGDTYSTVDFTAFNTPGKYFLYLPGSNIRSYDFEVKDTVYDIVGAVALKSYYYQRCNHDKASAYATDTLGGFGHGSQWVDSICHFSDFTATAGAGSVNNGTLDLHGGWHDAGDYQKTLWDRGVPAMLFAYEMKPNIWPDGQVNIPESGNVIPDLLDEVKWELDFYLRMQRPDGHFISSVSATWAAGIIASPPSQSNELRYYYDGTYLNGGRTVTSTTATGNAVLSLAHAEIVFRAAAQEASTQAAQDALAGLAAQAALDAQAATVLTAAADNYFTAANNGWAWLNQQLLLSAADYQLKVAAAAAVFRMDPVKATTARAVAEAFAWDTWGGMIPQGNVTPGESVISLGAWHYLLNTSGSSAIQAKVRAGVNAAIVDTAFSGIDGPYGGMFSNATNGWDWGWGSNREQSYYGFNLMMAVRTMATGQTTLGSVPHQIDGVMKLAQIGDVTKLAQKHLHFLLGLNPINMVYLTNMTTYGGEHSSFQAYHQWFSYTGADGDHGNLQYNGKPTWVSEPLYPYYADDIQTSTYGPAPGLVVGGPNFAYTGSYIIPKRNWPAYAYRDFSVGFGVPGISGMGALSYELTEPDVAYQGPFLALVSFFM